MRTFPNAWVLPGGGIDYKESIIEAGLREVEEEVGLKLKASNYMESSQEEEDEDEEDKDAEVETVFPDVFACWESNFPTTYEECLSINNGELKKHHFIVFISCKLKYDSIDYEIDIQEEELDLAAWLSQSDLKDALDGKLDEPELAELNSIYGKNGSTEGIGQGHAWALRKYLQLQNVAPETTTVRV